MKTILIICLLGATAATFYAAYRSANAGIEAEVSTRLAPLGEAQAAAASAQARADELGAQITTLDAQIAALEADNQTLIAEHDAVQAALDGATVQVGSEELRAEIAGQIQIIDDLTNRNGQLVSALDSRDAELEQANVAATNLSQTVALLTTQKAALTDQIMTLTDDDDAVSQRIGQLEGALSTRTDQLAQAQATIANLTAANADDGAQRATDLESRIAELDQAQATIAVLNDTVAARDLELAALSDQLASRLTDVTDGADTRIAELESGFEDMATELAEARSQIVGLRAELTQTNVALTQSQALSGKLSAIASRKIREASGAGEAALENVRTAQSVAAVCSALASSIVEAEQINFATGTSTIADSSANTLERLTGIALACSSEDMIIEVGGHTDSQGNAENNQRLSEDRARAVVEFMTQRGLSEDRIRATGFGENVPVADNDTDAGRAANRRITFDWQAG